MKCPLTINARFYTGPGVEVVGGDCLKEECAWWMNGDTICAIPALAANLNEVALELTKINGKRSWNVSVTK